MMLILLLRSGCYCPMPLSSWALYVVTVVWALLDIEFNKSEYFLYLPPPFETVVHSARNPNSTSNSNPSFPKFNDGIYELNGDTALHTLRYLLQTDSVDALIWFLHLVPFLPRKKAFGVWKILDLALGLYDGY
ncbi:Uncharacterized protein Rs2_33197 [Raphanus sativus]|nr:Uncharacterized protein Rs2_33197 [Raphanus sativus]